MEVPMSESRTARNDSADFRRGRFSFRARFAVVRREWLLRLSLNDRRMLAGKAS